MSTSEPSHPRRNPPRKGSQKNLPSIPEDSQGLPISDESGEEKPPSPGYDPEAERRVEHAAQNNSTPRSRKKSGSSTSSKQKQNARTADPNGGRCLVTNLSKAVETSHLVASATPSNILTKLENAWGLSEGKLNVDSRYNLHFLRADWHKPLDDGRWMLVPDLTDLQLLQQVTIDKAPSDRSQIDLEKTFKSEQFSYHLLPMPRLKGPICRFKDPDNSEKYIAHRYPFATLGPLISHVKPQYVVVNAGKKLYNLPAFRFSALQRVLKQVSSQELYVASQRLSITLDLYTSWVSLAVPADLAGSAGDNQSDNEAQPPSEHPSDARSREDQPDDDEQSGDDEVSSPSRSKRGRQLQDEDVLPSSTQSSEDSITEDDDWNPSEETAWTEEICSWVQKCSDAAVSEGGWECGVLNEDQVGAYAKEHPLSVPPPESWHKWRPRWEKRSGRYPPFNTEKFSSNDWASFQEDTYLTWPARR